MFRWLAIINYKEKWGRDDDQYFIGSAIGIIVRIGENSLNSYRGNYKKHLGNYPFEISLSPEGTNQAADYQVQHAHIFSWRLSHKGFRCFVPKDRLKVYNDQDGMVYDT